MFTLIIIQICITKIFYNIILNLVSATFKTIIKYICIANQWSEKCKFNTYIIGYQPHNWWYDGPAYYSHNQ